MRIPDPDTARAETQRGRAHRAAAERRAVRAMEKHREQDYLDYAARNAGGLEAKVQRAIRAATASGKDETSVLKSEYISKDRPNAWSNLRRLMNALLTELRAAGYTARLSSSETPADDGYPDQLTVTLYIHWRRVN